jgi:hypothetical protein
MIDQVDGRLQDWIGTVLTGTTVSLAAPTGTETGRGIGLYLMELIRTPPPRGDRRPPLQITLRYIVTAWAEQSEEAHRILGELVFAAMEHMEFEVERDPVPVALWTALGVAPRPSFVLRVPLQLQRPERIAPLVRVAPVVRKSSMASLHGRVYGPGDVPVMGARVELPALQLSTSTDFEGRFHFAAIPTEPPVKRLIVKAKGQELSVATELAVADGEPLSIRLQGLEG